MATMLGLIVSLLGVLSWIEIDSSQKLIEDERRLRIRLMNDVFTARCEVEASELAQKLANFVTGSMFSSIPEQVTNALHQNLQMDYAMLMSTNARVLFHVDQTKVIVAFGGESKATTNKHDLDVAQKTRLETHDFWRDGAKVLEAYAPIQNSDGRWGVLRLGYSRKVLNQEMERIQQDVDTQVRAVFSRSLKTAGGIAVLGMVVIAWLSGLISRPLLRVTASARQLATGDFSAAARLDIHSKDEVGVLADAFRKMADNLQHTYAALEESNRTLEVKVKERTRELAQMTQVAEEARQEAEGASRTKSAFLASMSHELRTPLTAIIGFSEMLLADAQADGRAEAADDLQRIMDSARHLLNLINEILDLSKIEAQKMELHLERFEVSNIIREVSNTLAPLVKTKANRLVITAAEGLGSINADLTKLRQSLLNLLSNANKFTDGGEVRLNVERFTRDGSPWIRFAISDTGIGMTPEQVGKLFQAFQQADTSTARKYGGTGLGLVITRKFCEFMGGTVTVTSQIGQGSTFTIELPAEVRKPEPKPGPSSLAASAVRTVLVLSPDQNVHQLVSEAIKGTGCELRIAPTGAAGVELARSLRPALITLDATRPVADGWSVMGELKSDPELAAIPVVLLALQDGEAAADFTLGAAEFLTKPVDSAALSRVMHRHLHYPPEGYVLLVEDDPTLREMMSRIIEGDKFPVKVAENGLRALELVRQAVPQLILLDIMMPVMDGFQFLGELRQRKEWAHVPVIVLTAKSLSPEEREFLAARTNSILQKGASVRNEVMADIRRHITKVP